MSKLKNYKWHVAVFGTGQHIITTFVDDIPVLYVSGPVQFADDDQDYTKMAGDMRLVVCNDLQRFLNGGTPPRWLVDCDFAESGLVTPEGITAALCGPYTIYKDSKKERQDKVSVALRTELLRMLQTGACPKKTG